MNNIIIKIPAIVLPYFTKLILFCVIAICTTSSERRTCFSLINKIVPSYCEFVNERRWLELGPSESDCWLWHDQRLTPNARQLPIFLMLIITIKLSMVSQQFNFCMWHSIRPGNVPNYLLSCIIVKRNNIYNTWLFTPESNAVQVYRSPSDRTFTSRQFNN